ncbi:lipoprotein insertase outer membrane protein LolB [Luteimonas yindakuii]|nr:lipoprotein insertase outer membrane protein LolB [Luteimonas yindakuii]
MSARFVALGLMLLVLAGCATTRQVAAPAAAVLEGAELDAAQSRLATREQALRAQPAIAFSGRVALAKGREGGNGRIEWRQQGGDYRVTLSAPVTRQSWSLEGGADGGARIDGLDGGPREGADAALLVRDATGLEIPVGALADWAAGMRADPARFGAAAVEYDANGQLLRLHQDGWTIDYLGWQSDVAGVDGGLPARVDARRDDARVRLIVDAWQLGDAPEPQ